MTLELFSTSVPAGLEPGRSGFCTVAMTRGLSRPLVEALEALSAYRPVFLPTDPRADDNPVALSYLRVPAAGRNYHVVSRIGFAGLDYTSRSNRFAHHVVLDAGDPRPAGGPAWLASRPGFLEAAFDGEIRYLPGGRAVPAGGPPSAACPTWQKLTGDAGWAGVVAEALASPAARSFFLVYDLGADVLSLLREAIGLLPPERRWEATFTTYFTGLPAGVGCTVRGVLRGSAEAASVQGSSLDLGKLAGKTPPVNEWTAAARVGRAVAARQVAVPLPVKAVSPPSPAQLAGAQPLASLPFADIHAPDDFGFDDGPRLERQKKPGGIGKWVVLTVLASLVVLVGGAGAVVMLRPDLFRRSHPVAEKGDEKDRAAPDEGKDKAGTVGDEGKPKSPGKFAPARAAMTMDRPVAGSPSLLRVDLAFPKDAPPFPLEKLRFTLDGKELSAGPGGDGGLLVTLPTPGPHKLVAGYAGDDRFDEVRIEAGVRALKALPPFSLRPAPRVEPVARLAGGVVAGPAGGVAVPALVVREWMAIPGRGPTGGPLRATRGETVELAVSGLPVDFGSHDRIVVTGAKGTPSPDGKKPIVLTDLKPGNHRLEATFPGDDSYAAGKSRNVLEVHVRRRPVVVVEPIDRERFSRGRVGLSAVVKGSDGGDPMPKGMLQLMSSDQMLAEGKVDDRGHCRIVERAPLHPGKYALRLVFTPVNGEEWSAVETPLPGVWPVVRTIDAKLNFDELPSPPPGARDPRKVWFKVSRYREPSLFDDLMPLELPAGKKYHLAFRPSVHPIEGDLEPLFKIEDGAPVLEVWWYPSKKAWGDKPPPGKITGHRMIVFRLVEPARGKRPRFDYHFVNFIKEGDEIYRPLIPAFRDVVGALPGGYIEVSEGGSDRKQVFLTRNKNEKTITTREKKDPAAPPLLRLKVLDSKE